MLEGNRSTITPGNAINGLAQGTGPSGGLGFLSPGASTTPRSMHLMEGRPSTIGCLCLGGYPPPSLAIRVGRKDLTADCSFRNSASLSGEKGLRTMDYRTERWTTRFVARAEDDEALIKCVAQVPGLEARVEIVKIYVQCKNTLVLCLSLYVLVCVPALCQSACVCVCLPVYPPSSLCVYVHQSGCLSFCLSAYLYSCPSLYPP